MKKQRFWGCKPPRKHEKEADNDLHDDEDEDESDSTDDWEDSTDGNRIYLYDEIGRKVANRLSRQLRKASASLLCAQSKYDGLVEIPIQLYINSYGGSLYDSFAIADMIKASKVPVHTVIEGVACSGATIISMAGAKRFMRQHSSMLIHQLSSWAIGTYENMKDDKENADMEMNMIYQFYESHCSISRKELKEVLKHDLFFPAKKCLELGMVDEII